MDTFSVTERTENNIVVVTCSGRFDAFTIDQVKPILDAATEAEPTNVLVNLGEVGFVDSSALSALVSGMKRARSKGGDLVICALQQPVRIIFELTRLDKAFTLVDDEAAGLAALA